MKRKDCFSVRDLFAFIIYCIYSQISICWSSCSFFSASHTDCKHSEGSNKRQSFHSNTEEAKKFNATKEEGFISVCNPLKEEFKWNRPNLAEKIVMHTSAKSDRNNPSIKVWIMRSSYEFSKFGYQQLLSAFKMEMMIARNATCINL